MENILAPIPRVIENSLLRTGLGLRAVKCCKCIGISTCSRRTPDDDEGLLSKPTPNLEARLF